MNRSSSTNQAVAPWKRNFVWVLAVIVCYSVYSIFFSAKIGVMPASDHLTVFFPTDKDIVKTVYFSDITAISLESVTDFGVPEGGETSRSFQWGNWKNEPWGSYTLCVSGNHNLCLVLSTEQGTVVLNLPRKEDTEALYQALKDHLANNGYSGISFSS